MGVSAFLSVAPRCQLSEVCWGATRGFLSAAPTSSSLSEFASQPLTPFNLKSLLLPEMRRDDGRQISSTKSEEAFCCNRAMHGLMSRLSHQTMWLQRMQAPCKPSPSWRRLEMMHRDMFSQCNSMMTIVEKIGQRRPTGLGGDPEQKLLRFMDALSQRHSLNIETVCEGKREQGYLSHTDGGLVRTERDIEQFLRIHTSFQLLCRNTTLHLKSLITHVRKTGSTPTHTESVAAESVAAYCEIKDIIAEALGEARLLAERHFHSAPDIQVIVEGDDVRVLCIPSHVHHILLEILKNAIKATIDHNRAHSLVTATILPPVRIKIVKGFHEVSICVSDEGGGMSIRKAHWAFKFTSSSSEAHSNRQCQSYQPVPEPLCGLGIGLPVSRLYARHFGGSLKVLSMQGSGTHCCIYIPLGDPGDMVERGVDKTCWSSGTLNMV
jgi:hypothetical protein